MKKILAQNSYFLLLFLLFLAGGAFLLFSTGKGDVVIWLSERRTGFLNFLFYYSTYLGGELVPVVILLSILVKFRLFLVLAVSNIVTSLTILLLKQGVFAEIHRPVRYFEESGINFNIIDGVTLFQHFSFPSGHAAGAFSLFFAMTLVFSHRIAGIFFFLLAMIVAFSRVYIGQHFFIDIYFGTMIAFVFTLLTFYLIRTTPWYTREWADKSLIKIWDWKKQKSSTT